MSGPAGTTAGLAYPVLYVAATGAALSMFWGLPRQQTRRAHFTLLVGIVLNTVGFVLWLPDYIHESLAPGSILDVCWMVGTLAIGIAGRQWYEDPGGREQPLVPATAVQFSRIALAGALALASAPLLIPTPLLNQTA